jgi:hypothetical protein
MTKIIKIYIILLQYKSLNQEIIVETSHILMRPEKL